MLCLKTGYLNRDSDDQLLDLRLGPGSSHLGGPRRILGAAGGHETHVPVELETKCRDVCIHLFAGILQAAYRLDWQILAGKHRRIVHSMCLCGWVKMYLYIYMYICTYV